MPTFKEYSKQRFVRIARRLRKLLRLDVPDNVLANDVVALLDAAKSAFGQEFYAALLLHEQEQSRQYAAYCQHCDNHVHPSLSHPPICEQCEAKAVDEEMDEFDEETN